MYFPRFSLNKTYGRPPVFFSMYQLAVNSCTNIFQEIKFNASLPKEIVQHILSYFIQSVFYETISQSK